MNDLFDLTGKVTVVTGASRGLGQGMALGLAEGQILLPYAGASESPKK